MLFPAATLGDLSFRLLLIRPNFSAEAGHVVEVQHRFDTTIAEGRTTIEERFAARSALLLSQRCTLALSGNARDDWRKGLGALGNLMVGMPLWIDALPIARWAERIYDPQQVINFHPTTGAFTLYSSDALPGSPTYPLYAPLLLGRWAERPPANVPSKAMGWVSLALNEASPYSCRIGINTQAGGWSAEPDLSQAFEDKSNFGLETFHVGGTARELGLDRVNSAARWEQKGYFTFASRLAIRQHLSHFVAQKGATLSWSPVPAWFQTGADTPGTPSNYTARFASDTLSLQYLNGACAKAEVGFIQEIDTGARSQSVASETYLYTFTYQHDSSNPELFTNWDAPLTGAEGTFSPGQCAHKEILLSLKPQDAKADLSVGFVAGSLMADWLVGRLFGRVSVKIEQCDPANIASTRTTIFEGFVRNVLPNGNTLQVQATMFGKTLEKRVPSDVFGPRCNAFVFDARCGLTESSFDSAGTVAPADVSSDGFTVTVHSPSGWGDGGSGTYAANWFGPNGILRTGSGRARQVATIVSSAMSGANLVVKLARPIYADMVAGGGQSVQLIPGCGQQYEADCIGKFDNGDAFVSAFPFMPDYIEQNAPNSTPKAKK